MDLLPEDTFADAIELLGEKHISDSEIVEYGDLVLSIAPKEGKANTLLSDQLFSPSILLAEKIESGELNFSGKTVVELGAGCALPSLLATTQASPPVLVVATDYPSEVILENLSRNVARNTHLARGGCKVISLGYEWGQDTSNVLNALCLLPDDGLDRVGFDVVIMSDLLHFDASHTDLVNSLIWLLKRHEDARVYVSAGRYTAWTICETFLDIAAGQGIEWSPECSAQDEERDVWLGKLKVKGLSDGDLAMRKANCWWWVGKWKNP